MKPQLYIVIVVIQNVHYLKNKQLNLYESLTPAYIIGLKGIKDTAIYKRLFKKCSLKIFFKELFKGHFFKVSGYKFYLLLLSCFKIIFSKNILKEYIKCFYLKEFI